MSRIPLLVGASCAALLLMLGGCYLPPPDYGPGPGPRWHDGPHFHGGDHGGWH